LDSEIETSLDDVEPGNQSIEMGLVQSFGTDKIGGISYVNKKGDSEARNSHKKTKRGRLASQGTSKRQGAYGWRPPEREKEHAQMMKNQFTESAGNVGAVGWTKPVKPEGFYR